MHAVGIDIGGTKIAAALVDAEGKLLREKRVPTPASDTDALVARGEYWLTLNGQTVHYKVGDVFKVARGVTHSEKYGAEGATFWAARKN